jgi:hypothetical protein
VENNDISHERRVADRLALDMVITLTERISSLIKRFEEYATRQDRVQKEVADKLLEHETLVIKGITSWKWIALLSGFVMAGVAVSFTEFMSLKESVQAHHIESAMLKQSQLEFNRKIELRTRGQQGDVTKDVQ